MLVARSRALSSDETYVVTLSFGETVPQPDRVALAESVPASWVGA